MQFNQDFDFRTYNICSYAEGEVVISTPPPDNVTSFDPENPPRLLQESLTQSAIIMADRVIREWAPQNFIDISSADIAQLAALKRVEIVLLGTGAKLHWPESEVLRPLIGSGIGFEVMDTAAACRTYNILMYEGRQVAAALLMI